MDKILGMGNALVDVLARMKNDELLAKMGLPRGSMQLIDEAKCKEIQACFDDMKTHRATGGSAGNTIMALTTLGVPTGFIGKVGMDETGDFFRKYYAKHNIEDKLLTHATLPSGIASTFISPDGERTFGTYLGAAATLHAEDLRPDMFKGYTYFYIEGYLVQDHDLILRAIELAKEAGLQVCLDMASYNIVQEEIEFFKLLINKYVDILFANEEEARAFTSCDPEEALAMLAQMCSIAIVKVGAAGSLIRKGSDTIRVQAMPVKRVVDTTGAGDYFAAGFLYGLTSGYSLERCANLGSLLSSHVIQVLGAQLTKARWTGIKQSPELTF